jgi:hypothetical protein
MARVKTDRGAGRPTKKTPEAIKRILDCARSGLPLVFAAQAGDIDVDTLGLWRTRDAVFAHALSHARLQAVEDRWTKIQKAGEDRIDAKGELKRGDWKSIAWQLERSHPHDFARPDLVLQNNVQTNVTNHNEIHITFEIAQRAENRAREMEVEIQKLLESRKPGALG